MIADLEAVMRASAPLLPDYVPKLTTIEELLPAIAHANNRDFLIVHGTGDRIARPANSAAVAKTLSRTARHVGYIAIKSGKHAMLKRHRDFDRLAADFAVATLLGTTPAGPVAQVLDGQQWLEI